jgi:hypothetical protein
VCFDDESLEWERASYNQHLFGPEGKPGDTIMPLGFMLNRRMIRLATAFLTVTKTSVHDPCVWLSDRPRLPVQYVAISGCFGFWSSLLWKAGVSAMELVEYAHRMRASEREAFVLHYRKREDIMLTVAWVCQQIHGTAWIDCTERIVKHVRHGDD